MTLVSQDHLSLMKKIIWTVNGLVFPAGVKRKKTKPVLSYGMKRLVEKSSLRILAFKNCTGQDGYEIIAEQNQIEKFLDECTMKMNLTSPAKYLYNIHGEKIENIINDTAQDIFLPSFHFGHFGPGSLGAAWGDPERKTPRLPISFLPSLPPV
ncbi:doublecortin domain-containing protein 1 [Alligator mississippiensis]|uniref:Doublecortin domain-containing protein 1 n=1 Tax=Alligator mississippiensis TaxID=8496 RepID=A0A151MBR6_ALLMI|nr:doublecortin domain-containing protein 1 [Alligator mississippiensis]